MKTIFDESSPILKLLPKQSAESFQGGRAARFILREPVREGVLCYNALLKILVLLSPEEDLAFRTADRTALSYDYFVSRYFFVPETFDELKTIDEVRSVLRLLQPKKPLHRFTILPTTDCNARCFYCFEAGCKREDMSMETAEKVAAFILKASKDTEAKLHWFGGEPLFRSEVIDRITGILRAADKEFTSDIVTNGYLFNEETVEKAVRDWHLQRAQITLDGTESVYNRRKAYIYKTGNPYEIVLKNAIHAARSGISIEIRLNVDEKNRDDLLDLIGELKMRLKDVPNVTVYSKMLYGEYENPRAYEAYYEVRSALEKAGIGRGAGIPRRIFPNRCMGDTTEAVVILPDGFLNSCEHFNEAGPSWGTLDDPSGLKKAVSEWSAVYPKTAQCLECARMVDCIRLKSCPVVAEHCSPLEREQRNREMHEGMRSEYERFLKAERNQAE